MQQNNEGEKIEGRWVLWVFLGVLFCGGSFFLKMFLSSLEFFLSPRILLLLINKHNKRFLPQKERFCHSLGFLDFCHSFREIIKENKTQRVCCTCERVNI